MIQAIISFLRSRLGFPATVEEALAPITRVHAKLEAVEKKAAMKAGVAVARAVKVQDDADRIARQIEADALMVEANKAVEAAKNIRSILGN